MKTETGSTIDESNRPSINLNLNVRGLAPSATLAINELSNELLRQGRTVYKLGLGQSPFPVPEPVVAALKKNAHQKDYLPVKGLAPLREAVAAYHRSKHGVDRQAENVLIGPGSKELMFLIQLVYYGDLVIPTPSWVSYAPQAQIIGRHVRWLPTRSDNNWKLFPEELDELCHGDPDRPRLLILNYPNNPVGHTYDRNELQEIARVARRYRVLLLSDEIYGEIHHRGEHVSIAEFYPEGTIISSGLSKWCGAGGWRLGTFTFPPSLKWLCDALAAVASETYTSTSAPIQYAAVTAFEGSDSIESYLRQCRRVLRALGNFCAQRMQSAEIKIKQPQGGFYLFPSFSPCASKMRACGLKTSQMLCEKLLADTGVAALPGVSFGRPNDRLTMRLAYVDFDGRDALAAAGAVPENTELDEAFVRNYCRRVAEAIDALCSWVKRMA